jgi:xanthine dehydrogenase YagR molybdenum-binding subunit
MMRKDEIIPASRLLRHGSSVGQPIARSDALLKVTGAARYTADQAADGMLHAVYLGSSVARGRLLGLSVEAAGRHPGVVAVMTSANRPPLAIHPDDNPDGHTFRLDALQGDTVRYHNQPIAVVIAHTLEAATEGAALLAPRYEALAPRTDFSNADQPFVPPVVGPGFPTVTSTGDTEDALATAAQVSVSTFETPAQYHNPMEPHAIVAAWHGARLSVDMPSQGIGVARGRLAQLLGIDADDIEIRSRFVGGGFGSKAFITGPQLLAVLASKLVGRPVKLVFQRVQMYGPAGHRAPTRQTFRLGFAGDGGLSAIDHHTTTASSSFDDFYEACGTASRSIYAAPAIRTSHDAVRLDTGTPLFMRAPGEASGSVALESAIDEAAHACGMDPLAFRLRNYAETDPSSGRPFSSKALRECYAQGAARFGWSNRRLAPRATRDNAGMLIGWGMGTAHFPVLMFRAQARAVLRSDGSAIVETGAHDIGQGISTALAQIAAETLHLDIGKVELRYGSSAEPDGGLAAGSAHTSTAGTAVHNASKAVLSKLVDIAVKDQVSPLFGAANVGLIAHDGRLARADDERASESYTDIMRRAGIEELEAEGTGSMETAAQSRYAMYSHGAVFAEVKVDPLVGQVRVTRLVGAFAAGRIVNPRLARSQLYGGMVWGQSFALNEGAEIDRRTGRIMNGDLGDYHIPTNADVGSLDVIIVDEDDPHVNPLGMKGVGELAVTGTAGAIANAVWHASGFRARQFPIRLRDVLPAIG